MDPINQSATKLQGLFASFWDTLSTVLPNIFGALLLILIGWGLARGASYLVKRLLQSLNFDVLGKRLVAQTSLKIDKRRVNPSQWVGTFVFWIILLVFFISASETLGWAAVSESISHLIAYLPQLFGALLVFVVGLYIASFVRRFISTTFNTFDLAGGRLMSEITFYFILLLIGTTALEQAGIETSILTANISIIIGGLLLAFAIGFGYSSRELLTNILSTFYARNTFTEGQTIRIDNTEGIITHINNIQTTINTPDGELIIPNKRLISDSIERLDHKEPSPVAHQESTAK